MDLATLRQPIPPEVWKRFRALPIGAAMGAFFGALITGIGGHLAMRLAFLID